MLRPDNQVTYPLRDQERGSPGRQPGAQTGEMQPGLRAPTGQVGHRFLREAGRAVRAKGDNGDNGNDEYDEYDRDRENSQ